MTSKLQIKHTNKQTNKLTIQTNKKLCITFKTSPILPNSPALIFFTISFPPTESCSNLEIEQLSVASFPVLHFLYCFLSRPSCSLLCFPAFTSLFYFQASVFLSVSFLGFIFFTVSIPRRWFSLLFFPLTESCSNLEIEQLSVTSFPVLHFLYCFLSRLLCSLLFSFPAFILLTISFPGAYFLDSFFSRPSCLFYLFSQPSCFLHFPFPTFNFSINSFPGFPCVNFRYYFCFRPSFSLLFHFSALMLLTTMFACLLPFWRVPATIDWPLRNAWSVVNIFSVSCYFNIDLASPHLASL